MNKAETAEMAVMKVEMKTLNKQMDNIVPKIGKIHDTFIKGEGKIKNLNNEVFGNGNPSLRKEISDIKTKFAYYAGGVGAFSIVVTILVQVAIKKIGG